MKDFIGTYQIGSEAVDSVLSFFHENFHLAYPGDIGNNVVDVSKKESLDLSIDAFDLPEAFLSYAKELSKCLESYKEEYDYCDTNHAPWGIQEYIKLQYYPLGGGFKTFHCENSGWNSRSLKRHLVFMTYLNTIPPGEGGGTEFLYQRTFDAVAGKTLIWPSAWTHTHRGIVSNTFEKYIITGWYSFLNHPSEL